ncbi:uncharacterized protein LOC124469236 [Hypomesus transpacificus]|uniref:uncharacterized protein LOC124469236 n=1 Tax=Hypomesus transpacificus TaxID=137520 RepID=UPI001F07D1EC|nr:uncharacterized protein LOC124469236 [Hypomesus transpacificus]
MSLSRRDADLKTKYDRLFKEALQLEDLPRTQDRVERLVSGEGSYVAHGGSYDTFQFQNTCVLDSLLAGIHCLDMQFPKIQELFSTDRTVNAVLRFMHHGEYNKAKALWLINLSLRSGNNRNFDSQFVSIRGYPGDHLPNFSDLVWATFHYDEDRFSPTSEDRLMKITLEAFQTYGDVKLLGVQSAQLVLVYINGRMDSLPPLSVTDDHERTYTLEFLLLGKITSHYNHMVLYTKLIGRWMIFDAAATLEFKAVDWSKAATHYFPCLAAYVKKEHQE